MQKLVTLGLVVLVLAVGGYFLYRYYFPNLIAQAILSEQSSQYIPKRIMNRVDEIREPVNKSAERILEVAKEKKIPLQQLLNTIDQISSEDVTQIVAELNQRKKPTADEVFSTLKKHVHTDFDFELLREAFVTNFDIRSFKKVMGYAKINQTTQDADIETVRAIAKQILVSKYEEMNNKKSN